MAWKTFDYSCMNEKCKEYHIKKEIMVKDSEKNIQICEFCGETLKLVFSATSIKTGDNNNRLKI
jgi:predicted SprT family Zn-dependent metalloprotease